MQVDWVLAVLLCTLEAELQHPSWLLKNMWCVYMQEEQFWGFLVIYTCFLFRFPVLWIYWLLSQSYFFYVIKSIIARKNVFDTSFSTSSYSLTCFTSVKYLKQSAQLSYPVLPTEIWLISYVYPFPLDFTSIMIDSRTIWNVMIFLAYSITFFSLMNILRKMHFFLCVHKIHYFFVWRSCLVCPITSSLWEIH